MHKLIKTSLSSPLPSSFHLSSVFFIFSIIIIALSSSTFAQEPSSYSVGGFVFRVPGVGSPVGTPVDIVNVNTGQNISTVTINPRGAYLIGDLNGDEGDIVEVHAHNSTHQGLRGFILPASQGSITEVTDINFSFNQIPILSNLGFNDSILAGDEDISLSVNYVDHDLDDGVLVFRWLVNGINVFNQTRQGIANGTTASSSLDETNFSKGDAVNVSLFASDLFYTSPEYMSIVLTVANSAPSASGVSLNNSNPKTNEDIRATVGYADKDADLGNVTFQWHVNNSNVLNQTILNVANGTSIDSNFSSAFFSRSDRVNVSVFVEDGEAKSLLSFSPVITVVNTAPSATSPQVQPSSPLTGDNLQASYNFIDIDGDPQSGSHIKWFRNGIEQTSLGNSTSVSNTLTTKGEKWAFTVIPGDGNLLGAVQGSANITVGNTQPSVSAVALNNSAPKTNDDLSASLAYSDPDGDAGNVTFRWFVNNSNVFSQTLRNVANNAQAISNFSSGFFAKSD
ncbi:hypothetical protein HYU13_04735, partial [Candidatus Woesearchaeota archaeon]|nr:hypothetical protein [Candidatus Woesearchaeota archaeon]